MAPNPPQPLSRADRAARLYDWVPPNIPPPTIDIPVVVNLQFCFHAYGSANLSPPILANALDCVDLNLLKDKLQASDYYVRDHLGDPKAYKFIVKLNGYERFTFAVLDGTTAGQITAGMVYQEFLQQCSECGSILKAELEAEALRKTEWERKNNKGRVKEGRFWEGRGKVYVADIWAKVEVYF